jgi:ankyrin repeat protein
MKFSFVGFAFLLFLVLCAFSLTSYAGEWDKDKKEMKIPPNVPKEVRDMIERVRMLDEKDAYKELVRGIQAGNKTRVKVILFVFPAFFNQPDTFGRTPLYNAIFALKKDLVKYFIAKGANIKKADVDGNTPLHRAAANGDVEIIKMLLDKGANIYLRNKQGRTPVFYAASQGRAKAVEFLISQGARANKKDTREDSPLHLAVMSGDADTVKVLLKHGADTAAKNKRGKTPADLARDQTIGNLLK